VKFIVEQFPNIINVKNKFQSDKPDQHPSLLLTLSNSKTVKVRLFSLKGTSQIQPKNIGAKSFLKKYFLLNSLQTEFNIKLEKLYRQFLIAILSKKVKDIPTYITVTELKKRVENFYPKFNNVINPIRTSFLFEVREVCFQLLKEVYNSQFEGIEHAFRELMLLDSVNIITRYTNGNKCSVDRWESNIKPGKLQLYKKGNDTIGIRSGTEALTIRFKFESGPGSSIKIATSFDTFPTENQVLLTNLKSIQKFETILNKCISNVKKNSNNAIGKCNEAMVYYQLLKEKPELKQIDDEAFITMIEKYSISVLPHTLEEIRTASKITAKNIEIYLREEFGTYEIESMQLVPDNYLIDRLDTGDLQLTLKVNGKYFDKKLSLKAIAKMGGKVTLKNPGVGTILGPQYFDIGSLQPLVDKLKCQFEEGKINHKQSLELVSASLGKNLVMAPQSNLKKGLIALLGSATAVITFYKENKCNIIEHKSIKGKIDVIPNSPTPIQTTLSWDQNSQQLSLRVKFSGGQAKGWSSLKLACEYKIEY
ncbi:hypothetical protein U5N28_03865, partial [Lysinibacillus telephonicus]